MNASDILTFLFDAIALLLVTVVTIDFFAGLVQLWQISTVPPEQQRLFDEKPNLKFYLESEAVTEPPAPPVEPVPDPEQPAVPPLLEEILLDIDIEHLQLRPARKIAKALNIAQKVNGRDQPLSFLRAQIKAKLQQPQEVLAEALEVLRELAS